MAKKINAASPAKRKSIGNDTTTTTPIIRRHQLILQDNPSIPSSRRDGLDRPHGRVLAFDVQTKVSPVLTSARVAANDETVDAMDLLLKGFANVTIQDAPPKKTTAIVPDTKRSAASNKKKKLNVDKEWTETDSATEEDESVSNSIYEPDDEDDLACSLNDSDDEDDENRSVSPKDLYSPERAKGMFHYSIHDGALGAVYNVRRSARISFGSPAGKKK